jgi:hypothetical protein
MNGSYDGHAVGTSGWLSDRSDRLDIELVHRTNDVLSRQLDVMTQRCHRLAGECAAQRGLRHATERQARSMVEEQHGLHQQLRDAIERQTIMTVRRQKEMSDEREMLTSNLRLMIDQLSHENAHLKKQLGLDVTARVVDIQQALPTAIRPASTITSAKDDSSSHDQRLLSVAIDPSSHSDRGSSSMVSSITSRPSTSLGTIEHKRASVADAPRPLYSDAPSRVGNIVAAAASRQVDETRVVGRERSYTASVERALAAGPATRPPLDNSYATNNGPGTAELDWRAMAPTLASSTGIPPLSSSSINPRAVNAAPSATLFPPSIPTTSPLTNPYYLNGSPSSHISSAPSSSSASSSSSSLSIGNSNMIGTWNGSGNGNSTTLAAPRPVVPLTRFQLAALADPSPASLAVSSQSLPSASSITSGVTTASSYHSTVSTFPSLASYPSTTTPIASTSSSSAVAAAASTNSGSRGASGGTFMMSSSPPDNYSSSIHQQQGVGVFSSADLPPPEAIDDDYTDEVPVPPTASSLPRPSTTTKTGAATSFARALAPMTTLADNKKPRGPPQGLVSRLFQWNAAGHASSAAMPAAAQYSRA